MGNRLKFARKSRNLTLKEMASMSNVSEITIWRYENNIRTPTLKIAKRISKALDIPLEKLF